MPVPTLEELFTPLTREQVVDSMLGVAEDLSLPIEAWQPESVGREILEITAQKVSDQSATGAVAAAGGLLDYAEGDWLTLSADQIYEVERVEATFATGTLRLTNTSAIAYVLAAGDIRAAHDDTGQTYTSTTGGTLNPSDTLDLTMVADEPGSDSNAAVGDITTLVTPLFGVTAANTTVFVGVDEETDAQLVTRARESMAKASPNGPADAYNYYAKTATRSADGTSIGVTRTNIFQGDLTITVYVADASGPIALADLDEVNTYIQENVVPTGYTVTVANATAVPVAVTATVYLTPGSSLSSSDIQTAVEERLIAYFANAPVGGYVVTGGFIFTSAIVGEIFQAAPADIIKVELALPLTDVPLISSEVATLTTVSISLGNP